MVSPSLLEKATRPKLAGALGELAFSFVLQLPHRGGDNWPIIEAKSSHTLNVR